MFKNKNRIITGFFILITGAVLALSLPAHAKAQREADSTEEPFAVLEQYAGTEDRFADTDSLFDDVNSTDVPIPVSEEDESETVNEKIPLSSVTLGLTRKVYTGTARTVTKSATVTAVVDGEEKVLTVYKDYSVSYKNNIEIGKATVTVTGKGNYTGTIRKTFSIVPAKTSIKSLKNTGGKLKIVWNTQTMETTGYQLQYSTSKNFPDGNRKTVTIADPAAYTRAVKGLNNNKTYYFRIRTYKLVGEKKYCSDWSKIRYIRFRVNYLTITGSGVERTVRIENPSVTSGGLKTGVWSEANGNDDIYWYKMTKQSDGSYEAVISAARVADTGKCFATIHTGKGVFLKKTSFAFTEKELKKSEGKYKIHQYAKAILASTGNSLRGAYDWAVNNITYQSMVVPMTLPKSGPYSVFTRQELYFVYAYENNKGNCFCFAASFYWCAKELGYDARLIEGRYGEGAHSWVEIDIDGVTYTFDPELEYDNHLDAYYKTYAEAPGREGYRKVPAY